MGLTKTDFIEIVADKNGISKPEAKQVLEAVISGLEAVLKDGQKLTLTGFGTFEINKRQARKGRNPQTGEEIDIPARNQVKFNPGKKLREAVNL